MASSARLRNEGSDSEDSEDNLFEYDKELTELNRMTLLKMSKSNNYFLFDDRLDEKLKVYRLDSISFTFFKKKQRIFQFVPYYSINLKQMKLMDFIFKKEKKNLKSIDHAKLIKHIMVCGVIKINDEGSVDFSFNSYSKQIPTGEFDIFGSIIKKKLETEIGSHEYNEYFFVQTIKFEKDGSQSVVNMTDRLLQEQLNLLEIELMYQYNLPENMKDTTRSEHLIETMKGLMFKKQNVVMQEIVNNEILVVNCGRYIKYSRIQVDHLHQLDNQLEFTDMNIEFKPETEIYRIWSTTNPDHIQIIATDMLRNLVFIVTWNIVKNMEVNMFQIKFESNISPENYVVRGM